MNRLLGHATILPALLGFYSASSFGQVNRPGSYEGMHAAAIRDASNIVQPLLLKYCGDSCQLIRSDVEIHEEVSYATELGFEGVAGEGALPALFAEKVTVEIQVDDQVTAGNRDKLRTILMNHLAKITEKVEVNWRIVRLPNIGDNSSSLDSLKGKLEGKIEQELKKAIEVYCPDSCLLAYIGIEGDLVSLDDAGKLARNRLVWDDAAHSAMRVDQVNVEVTMANSIPEEQRKNILNILAARTRFVDPIRINPSYTDFPRSHAELNGPDPYGLEKLRQMLIMFRDLAGTKEIFTNSTLETSKERNDREFSKSESVSSDQSKTIDSRSNTNELSSTNKESNSLSENSQFSNILEQKWVPWAIGGLILLIIALIALRFVRASSDQKMMMTAADAGATSPSRDAEATSLDAYRKPFGIGVAQTGVANKEELAATLRVQALRDELIESFMKEPKVAKETFSRMLKEEGVELTAKYLHLFGHMIILELLDDPNHARDLYGLSEFFHKTDFSFDVNEQYALMRALKTRQVASEIRVLSNKSSDQFKFLDKLDPAQIHTLVSEEKPTVQSIVLTQLDKKRRLAVFDMYQGDSKFRLMDELANADAIPKEFLHNVAKALAKKVKSRPEFDTENIRSSEIIMDLLERSHLNEQRIIVSNLRRKHPETARGILMRLVTLEFLPYLKDGHLLELILGMDREDLVVFLAAVDEHIRDLLLSKAPAELAESWIEELQNVGSINESTFKLVELKIFNRIRSLAESGAISILDINEMLFSEQAYVTPKMYGNTLSNSAAVA